MPSLLIHTLGCKLNQLESEALADAFRQSGFTLHDSTLADPPSVIIINTCTVTSKADQKARRLIRKSLRDYPDSLILVTGCYAQLDQAQLKELGKDYAEERLIVLKGMDKNILLDLPEFISKKINREPTRPRTCSEASSAFGTQTNKEKEEEFESIVRDVRMVRGENSDQSQIFQFAPERFSSHTRSFLKIQDGCGKHCTYCRIRLARGPSVSLPAEQALERLKILEKTHAEAVLTGVNISQYRESGADCLGALLELLLAGTAKIALRLSSLAPDTIDENLARVLSHKRIRPHFHLSIQSGSQQILEKMGRGYTPQTVEKAAALLRRAKNDPFLACDIIAGFPSETGAEFEKTRDLCQKIDFAWIHAFPYSKRPGTPASSFPDPVQETEITKRVQILTSLARQGRAEYVKRWLGREVDVLIEKSAQNSCRGVSENYLKLLVTNESSPPPPGTVLRCRLAPNNETNDFDAMGEVQ